MNERITFVMAAVASEIGASVLFYKHSPDGPLCAGSSNLLTYLGQHGPLVTILWLLVLTAAWLYAGIRFIRPRQNLSTKLQLLLALGLAGIVIDNLVSIYQFESSPDTITASTSTAALVTGLAERTLLYVVVFAATVLLAYLLSLTQKPTETPPPSFGRE